MSANRFEKEPSHYTTTPKIRDSDMSVDSHPVAAFRSISLPCMKRQTHVALEDPFADVELSPS